VQLLDNVLVREGAKVIVRPFPATHLTILFKERDMLTFDQSGKDDLIAKLTAHAKADAIIKGRYFEDGKGCAVGCSLVDYGVRPSDHSQYEKIFGIPEKIARLEDCIFEGLPIDLAKEWPLRFSNAVPVKTDLSGVWPKFAIALMIDEDHGVIKYAKNDNQRDVIERCADLYKDGPDIDLQEAIKVRRAAAAAAAYDAYAAYAAADAAAADADAAAAAAAAAADAAADAAAADARSNHYIWMADKLIELMKAA